MFCIAKKEMNYSKYEYFYYLIAITIVIQSVICELDYHKEKEDCKQNEYFDLDKLQCIGCERNKSFVTAKDGFSCSCSNQSREILLPDGKVSCVPCKPNEILSDDGSTCVARKCSTNPKYGKMSCIVCGRNQITISRNEDGSSLKEVKCLTCSSGYKPSLDKTKCVKCDLHSSNGITCSCNEKLSQIISGICVEGSYIKGKEEYIPENLYGIWKRSDRLEMLAYEYQCLNNDKKFCRKLAQMCVLSLYDMDNRGACSLWLRNSPQVDFLPLMYGENDIYAILNQKLLKANYSYVSDKYNRHLKIAVASYGTNGNAVEFKHYPSEWGGLCPGLSEVLQEQFQFGANFRHSCKISYKDVLSKKRASSVLLPFFLYTKDTDQNMLMSHHIPVAIKMEGSDYMKNSDGSVLKLFKRYFIINKASSHFDNVTIYNQVLAIYLKKLFLKIRVHKAELDGSNQILTPIMYLEYSKITKQDVTDNKKTKIVFEISYQMEKEAFLKGIEISTGVLSALAIAYSSIRGWANSKRKSIYPGPNVILTNIFIYCAFNIGNVLFMVAFGACLHSLIVYSFQNVVYELPPTRKDEKLIESFIISAFTLKLIEVIWLNYRQVTCDIFLLDWNLASKAVRSDDKDEDSLWRQRAMAKRWLSMQTERPVFVTAYYVITVFVLETIATFAPKSTSTQSYNFAYAITIMAIVYILSACTKWLYRKVLGAGNWSVPTDVSLFIFEDEFYGHYMHDRGVPVIDETGNKGKERQGLLPGQEYWSFVMCCSQNFKGLFNRLYDNWLMEEINKPFINDARRQTPSVANQTARSGSFDNGEDYISSSDVNKTYSYKILTRFMAAFIDQALEGESWSVRQRSNLERLLNIELGVRSEYTGQTTLLYNRLPDEVTYTSVLWYGEEWTLISFELSLFGFIIFFSNNHLLAGFVLFVTFQIMKFCREFFGGRNFSRKTGIDPSVLK